MNELEFRPAASLSSSELAALFTRGYQRYLTPVSVDATDFENMVLTSDLDLEASCVGFEKRLPVTFALLGVRGAHGWVGGMGVIPEARGRGYGRAAMMRILAAARALAIAELDLEVLEHNLPAARIYQALGFRDRRWVDVWVRNPGVLVWRSGGAAAGGATELPVDACLELHTAFQPIRSPWQRDLPSLRHWAPRLSAVGVRDARGIAGFVLYRATEDRLSLADLAVAPGADIAPLASALAELIAARPACTTMLVNLPTDSAFAHALREVGAQVRLRQREMTLALD